MGELMVTPEIAPRELENPDDSESVKVEAMKCLLADKNDANENSRFVVDLAKTSEVARPVVSLSWRKNFKAVTNWMRKHMGTYPETREGFLVRFIDDKGIDWYRVERCSRGEKWEEIDGVDYKILPFRFDVNRSKKNENNMRK